MGVLWSRRAGSLSTSCIILLNVHGKRTKLWSEQMDKLNRALGTTLGSKIVNVLGMPEKTFSFTITAPSPTDPIEIECHSYVSTDEEGELIEEISKYELVEKEE